jgi:uncharacterized protein YukE
MVSHKLRRVNGFLDQGVSYCCILGFEVRMPFVKRQVRHATTSYPDRDIGIGNKWRKIAKEIRELAQEARALGSALDANWEGNSRTRFSEQYHPEIGNILACAESLESLADRIEAISVTLWETSWETVWLPEETDDQE